MRKGTRKVSSRIEWHLLDSYTDLALVPMEILFRVFDTPFGFC